jgi:hypothetical protein
MMAGGETAVDAKKSTIGRRSRSNASSPFAESETVVFFEGYLLTSRRRGNVRAAWYGVVVDKEVGATSPLSNMMQTRRDWRMKRKGSMYKG